MDPLTKDYIDARDEAAEARLTAFIRESRAQINANDKIFQAAHAESIRINRRIELRMDAIESAMISVKKTVIITGITATLSTVFGVAAFNAALLSNMQNSFDSGRFFSAAQMEVMQRMKETAALSRQAQAASQSADVAGRKMEETAERGQAALQRLESRIEALERRASRQQK